MNIKINTKKKLNVVSPLLYGIFFEDINYSGDGGLYGELVANRSFEYYDRNGKCDMHKMCWEAIGNVDFEIKTENPINPVHTHYAYLNGDKNSGIRNTGYCKEGFSVHDGDVFDFSCYAAADAPVTLIIQISDSHRVYGKTKINLENNKWTKLEKAIKVSGNCSNAFLEILLENQGSVNLEFVSLFNSDTFCGRKNGMRRDMSEMLKALNPKFMRFPGGCIVEGRSFENMYRWKDTIGPIEERKTNWNRWQMEEYQREGRNSDDYFQSYGLGFYEYFLLCEDLGAKPIPVVNCGMTCQWHEGLLADMSDLDSYIQDVLDLIEFANGSEDSQWGKRRIEMGHKEPFNLEYIGIGNEQWGTQYFERYEAFEAAISSRYPDIKLITSAGWTIKGEDYDTAQEWMRLNKSKAYAVDEHFYKDIEWFINNTDRYDAFDRTMPKIFAGEYAAHSSPVVTERKNNWYTALAEAAFLTGVERNSDHVIMTCYAPLFGRKNHQQWQPNLIWFDNDGVYATPNYHIQRLFSNNTGDYAIDTECPDEKIKISATVSEDETKLYIKIVNLSENTEPVSICTDRATKDCILYEITASRDAETVEVEKKETSLDDFKLINGNSVVVLSTEII